MQQSTPTHGVVADLVKAYNTLPRGPVRECLSLLGVQPWFLDLWNRWLSDFIRYFIVHRRTSDAVLSVTGYPEGCPLSCVAMSAIDLLWHIWQSHRVPRALALSFVDNLELVSPSVSDLLSGFEALRLFCSFLDLQLDERQLYAWSTSSEGRSVLRKEGLKLSFGDRDLGGQVLYSGQLRNAVLTDRIAAVLPYFKKLRWCKLPIGVKITNIRQVLWPRALHGCSAMTLADSHLHRLRSGVMQALNWNRAGASPVVRISLLHTGTLDPEWYPQSAPY